ncbi:MAG: class I SAM-dependent methyltransferase [Vicinamibacteria bacterium]
MSEPGLRERVIDDFGEQWVRYPEGGGYFDSDAFFRDVIEPLLSAEDFRGASVAEIGSGQGRIVASLARFGASHVVALEPSAAMKVLRDNTREFRDRITYLESPGDQLPPSGFDFVVAIGVIHHIPDPEPVVRAVYRALRPGGLFFMWVYGKEGNELYLALATPLRRLSSAMPPLLLGFFTHPLAWALSAYAALCRLLPLPLRDYTQRVIAPLGMRHRRLVIFDQLHPAWAKYYTHEESVSLLEDAGFVDVRAHHRHGYSWSLVGTRPAML